MDGQVVLEVLSYLHQSVSGGGVVQGQLPQVVLEAFSNLSESVSG